MPVIRVCQEGELSEISFSRGASLKDILNAGENMVTTGCSGNGACGLCRVRIEEGDAGSQTASEQFHLDEEELNSGIRLSCQVYPESDLTLTIITHASESEWHNVQDLDYVCPYPVQPPENNQEDSLIGAVDLGTTTLSLVVCRMADGKVLSACEGPNPQSRIGPDVITRLNCARDSEEDAKQLRNSVITAIAVARYTCLLQQKTPGQTLHRVFLVGNTAMLALLTGKGIDTLLAPGSWDSYINILPDRSDGWLDAGGLRELPELEVIPPLGGFIGSDLLAGVIHTRLMDHPGPVMLIDFGTNTEMALWDGTTLWVTSAAGGPAFEGEGISCGMKAIPGAVYRFKADSLSGQWISETILGRKIKGICGSGLVDALALLLSDGYIDTFGRIIKNQGEPGILLPVSDNSLHLNKADIGILQQAKAAVGAGISVLCNMASVSPDQLESVYIGGMFGKFLHVENAITIGLLPPVSPARVFLPGNTALMGCIDLGLSKQAREVSQRAREALKLVNMAYVPLFDDYYFKNLYLRRISSQPQTEKL